MLQQTALEICFCSQERFIARAIAGESILIIDISSFMISVVIGQLVSYKLLTYRKLPKVLDTIALLALVLLAVCFAVFTFLCPTNTNLQRPNHRAIWNSVGRTGKRH
jgi:Mn2+/Fe2+ NRAMP family transporter